MIYARVRRDREPRSVISSKHHRTIIHPLISFNYLISSQFAANVRIDINVYGHCARERESPEVVNRESAARVPVLLAPYDRAR